MIVGLLIPLVCVFFSVLLLVVYFIKKRINNDENRVYKRLIIVNFITLIFEFVLNFLTYNYIPFISVFMVRIYLILLILYIYYLSTYMAIVMFKGDDDKILKRKVKYKIIFFIGAIFILFLGVNLKIGEYGAYADGGAVYVVFFVTCLYQCMWLVNLIKNRNHKDIKYVPFYLYLTIGQFFFFVQVMNPGFQLVTPMELFFVMLMFFTIENPDMKLLSELELARDNADRANRAKSDFLSNMSYGNRIKNFINNMR